MEKRKKEKMVQKLSVNKLLRSVFASILKGIGVYNVFNYIMKNSVCNGMIIDHSDNRWFEIGGSTV